ncbi:MAG TPA: calcium-binding protein [Stellaceae bacterium]|nr:calcium-binding protein [Stellaceae bacterium]
MVFSIDGSNPPPAVSGVFNLEIITSPTGTSYTLPTGYQGLALLPGGTGQTLNLLLGNINVVDSGSSDSIIAGSGNSSIGGAQGDTITGGTGTDFIDGSKGNQSITIGSSGSETIYGGAGDTINAGAANVTIGGAQGDTIGAGNIGNSGTDFFDGSKGNQVIGGGISGSETIWGGAGDTISGGGGASETIGGVAGDTISGGTGNEVIDGSQGNQSITGGGFGNETIYGGAGDTINGGGSADTIGGAAGDKIIGGSGPEFIDGSKGIQTITAGNATFGNGAQTIWGGVGDAIGAGTGIALIGMGGLAAQTFNDNTGVYNDTITAFSQSAGDRIHLTTDTVSNALAHTTQVNSGQDTKITLSDGSTILLKGITTIDGTFFS